jgi:serine/threonine protein kinase
MIATGMDDGSGQAGDSLRVRLQACRQEGLPGLPTPELLRYVAEVASYLDVRVQPHGNVKPDTICVVDGHSQLTENLLAGVQPAAGPGTISGTPAYMAPEVWAGSLTAKSDQYALACTYAELRIGRPPFCGSDVPTVMRAHLESPPDLEGCTDTERRVLMRALAKAADQRFSNCRQFAEHLERAIATSA